ncbi:hypothetical protein ACIBF1_08480 [Spirillospora sp. NPDC050679]
MAKGPSEHRARVLATVTRLVAVLLVPVAFCRAPGHARFLACQWALGLRFPAEDLRGLAPETLAAFTHPRHDPRHDAVDDGRRPVFADLAEDPGRRS